MSEENRTAEQELQEAMWLWMQRLVLALVLLGAGYFAAWYQAKDYTDIKVGLGEANDTIVDLKNERETLSTRIARELRDKEVCRKELRALKSK
ncbi:MAG: hypothetical protein HRT46_01880 [Deltaproteobacteria bacterium]|nr:hypothetical protein [Deltaproteobacteria bacterium]